MKAAAFLLTVAVGLALIPFGLAFELVISILTVHWIPNLPKYAKGVGVALSQLLNVTCARFLTDLCVQRNGLAFGDPDHTTSAVLGWNQAHNTVTPVGGLLISWLDILESEHCLKAYRAQWTTSRPSNS